MKSEIIPFPGTFLTPEARAAKIIRERFERGIILRPNVEINLKKNSISTGDPWPRLDIHRSLLFWDRITIPRSKTVDLGISADLQFLIDCNLADEFHTAFEGSAAKILALSYAACFSERNRIQPGQWALRASSSSFELSEVDLRDRRGATIELHRAIPIPEGDTPLSEILDFRVKRRDELNEFRSIVDKFFEVWLRSEDKDFTLRRLQNEISTSVRSLSRTMAEKRFKVRKNSFLAGIALSSAAALEASIALPSLGFSQDPLTITATAAAVASFGMTFQLSSAPIIQEVSSSPFKYAFSIEDELCRRR